ncbi:MAG: SPOR domain-containing protein [Bacteroidaceae bacterium]
MKKTTTYAAIAASLFFAFSLSSCKSNESMYKKAYEKAQAMNQNTQVTEEPAVVNVTPVQQQTTTTTTTVSQSTTTPVAQSNVKVQEESVQVIDGAGLKAFSVVCGSFSLQANAVGLQQKLKQNGYQAQIALNPERKLYRVIASTHDTKDQAIDYRNRLRESYPDAWLLYKK